MTETGFLRAERKNVWNLEGVYPGFRLTVGRIQAANNCHDDLGDIRSRGEHNFELQRDKNGVCMHCRPS
jgi:hypothetical protein